MLPLLSYSITLKYLTKKQTYTGKELVDANVIAVGITYTKIFFIELPLTLFLRVVF